MQSVLNEGLPFADLVSSVIAKSRSGVEDMMSNEKNNANRNRSGGPIIGSISSYTKDLVMTFPLLTDTGISAETASMISRANERNIVTMFQMFFASQSFQGTDGIEILKSLHKNLGADSKYTDADLYNDAISGNFGDIVKKVIVKKVAESSITMDSTYQTSLNKLINEMVDELKTPKKSFPVDSFSEKSINDYEIINIYGNSVIREAKDDIVIDPYTGDQISKSQADTNQNAYNYTEKQREDEKNRKQRQRQYDITNKMNDKNYELNKKKDDVATAQQMYQNNIEANRNRLIPAEVKKSNELQPTLIGVDYTVTVPQPVPGTNSVTVTNQVKQFVAGIKSRIIPIDTMDMVERIVSKNKNKVSFANFIKATTGETGFWRDFIFAAKQAKINAKNAVKKGPAAQIWNMLEKRSLAAARNKYKKDANNDASRITGIVLSQNTVEYMKRVANFDIEKPNNAKQIMDAYNLMSIFIADPSTETVKSLYDGNNTYEVQAYSFLQREGNEMNYKKVIDLMSNMRR